MVETHDLLPAGFICPTMVSYSQIPIAPSPDPNLNNPPRCRPLHASVSSSTQQSRNLATNQQQFSHDRQALLRLGLSPITINAIDTVRHRLLPNQGRQLCITNNWNYFIEPPTPIQTHLKGIGGSIQFTHSGTLRWTIEDDNGLSHTITLPGSYYAKDIPFRFLSPQHWSQVSKDHKPKPNGTWCATYSDRICLF